MHISTNTSFDLTQICLQRAWESETISSSAGGICFSSHHGNKLASLLSYWKDKPAPFIDVDSAASLNLLLPYLILLIFFFLLLSKFTSSNPRVVKIDDETCTCSYSCLYPHPHPHPHPSSDDDENKIKTDLLYISDDCSINEELVAGGVHGEETLFFLSEEKCHGYTEENEKTDIFERCSYTNLANENKESDIEYSDMFATSDHFHSPQSSIADDVEAKEDVVDAYDHEEKEKLKTWCSDDHNEEGLLVSVKKLEQQRVKIQEACHEYLGDGDSSASSAESSSKSSCEWRSSARFRDSENDALFSSSSRRSSSNWESYGAGVGVYPKYDEEMLFFDRITSQKLRETECLRSIKCQPRSISERIVDSFSHKKMNISQNRWSRNPYHELEAAYVAQICLAWEALNWNYSNFKRENSGKSKPHCGYPAHVAQQFQQFQVMLQRFIENEPYEYGTRPEIFCRMRISTPKLLQVPEFQGCDDNEGKVECFSSRISSPEFLRIMDDVIRTFMKFLKGDREKFWLLKSFGKTKSTPSVDPTLVNLMRKAIHKKKTRLNDLRNSRKCKLAKRKSRNEEDEMETLMGLIDMKIVSRVLRMPEINEQQLQWCEEKMTKVRFWNGRVQRDSSPLFFPA